MTTVKRIHPWVGRNRVLVGGLRKKTKDETGQKLSSRAKLRFPLKGGGKKEIRGE